MPHLCISKVEHLEKNLPCNSETPSCPNLQKKKIKRIQGIKLLTKVNDIGRWIMCQYFYYSKIPKNCLNIHLYFFKNLDIAGKYWHVNKMIFSFLSQCIKDLI